MNADCEYDPFPKALFNLFSPLNLVQTDAGTINLYELYI